MFPQSYGWSRLLSCAVLFAILLVAFHTEINAQDCRGSGPVRKVIGTAFGATVGVAEAGVGTVRAWNCKVRKGVRNVASRVRSWGSSGSSYGCNGTGVSGGCTGSAVAPSTVPGQSVLESTPTTVVPLAPPVMNCPNGQCPQIFQSRVKIRVRSVIQTEQSDACESCNSAENAKSEQIIMVKERYRFVSRCARYGMVCGSGLLGLRRECGLGVRLVTVDGC